MSLKKFAEDFEKHGFSTEIEDNKINLDYENIQFYLEFNEEWIIY